MQISRGSAVGPGDGHGEAARIAMYKTAFEEGKRSVEDQLAELDSMRSKSLQFLAFTGAATAFLVGAGLKPETSGARDTGFYGLALTATVVSVLSILGVISLLLSKRIGRRKNGLTWNFRLSSKALAGWVEPEVGAAQESKFYLDLANHYDAMFEENAPGLLWMHKRYVIVLILCNTQVLLWAALVWVFA